LSRIRIIRAATAFMAALIVMLAFVLGIQPRIQEVGRVSSELAAAEAVLQSQQSKLARLIELAEDVTLLEREKELLEVAIPAELRISEFVRELNTSASRAGVNITGLDIGAPTQFEAPEQISDNPEFKSDVSNLTDTSFYVVDLDVTLTGSLSSIKEFIKVFQNNPRTVLLHKFLYSSKDGATEEDTLSLKAQVFILSS
jgi:Tfp pilus assembly protein PilO